MAKSPLPRVPVRAPRTSAPGPAGRLVGYARVSTEDQATNAQIDELTHAGCETIFQEHGSGASRARPELARLMATIGPGDVLVVVRLDRLARSVSHLLALIETLESLGAHFKSLRDPIDTSTAQGMFSLQVLGAVAQLERALISERTKAGVRAAVARGKRPGNPGLRAGDPAAIAKAAAARNRVFTAEVLASADRWLPTVKRMRPAAPWIDVVSVLNQSCNAKWTVERLRRAVRRAVREGLAEPSLIDRAPPRTPDDRLTTLCSAIVLANPGLSLREIGARLEAMHERTPRGGRLWAASSVKGLLDRAGAGERRNAA
jgi:DNA invertase Pin-like site-specific DNA recombinase